MQTKKNDMGVSPVIAVILMVAITVVLAGVVFLWAQSFTDQAGDDVKTLNLKVGIDSNAFLCGANADHAGVEIEVLGGTINWNEYKILINVGGSDIILYNALTSVDVSAAPLSANGDSQSLAGETVWYTQDTLTTASVTVGSPYTVKIVDIDGNRVAWKSENVIATA